MRNFTHKEVKIVFYHVEFSASNRMMPETLNGFFKDLDTEALGDAWYDCKTTLRDYEGDFEGVEIYFDEEMKPAYEYIANKIGVDYSVLEGMSIKLTC